MESLPKSPLLNFPPDTLEVVRKAYDLDGPGRMNQAIDILDEWVKQQRHFVRKDFRESHYFNSLSYRMLNENFTYLGKSKSCRR